MLQFLKSGIMEIPDVLVVTKADLGQIAMRTTRDLKRSAALARLEPSARSRRLLAAPAERHRGARRRRSTRTRRELDLAGRRLAARRAGALADFVVEHGERGLRALGGRRGAELLVGEQDPDLDAPALVAALERSAGVETRSAEHVRRVRPR